MLWTHPLQFRVPGGVGTSPNILPLLATLCEKYPLQTGIDLLTTVRTFEIEGLTFN